MRDDEKYTTITDNTQKKGKENEGIETRTVGGDDDDGIRSIVSY